MSQTNGSVTLEKPVNGDRPQSQTLDHIISYPLVSDSITMYQNNPLGAQSISIFQSLYHTFAEPVLPYLQTPYSIVAPYLAKADSLGDSTLETVDNHFPAIKTTDMEGVKNNAFSVAQFPFKVAGESKEYVFKTYDDEYSKVGGEAGIFTTGKAIVSTELRIASDAIHAVADFIGPRKQAMIDQLDQAKKTAMDKTDDAKKYAQQKKEQYVNHN